MIVNARTATDVNSILVLNSLLESLSFTFFIIRKYTPVAVAAKNG